MQTELTFRLKRNKAVESLGLVLVSGSKVTIYGGRELWSANVCGAL